MPRYGVINHEPYEMSMMEFDKLKAARAWVRKQEETASSFSPNRLTLVRILSEHKEYSNPQPVEECENNQTTFTAWSKENK